MVLQTKKHEVYIFVNSACNEGAKTMNLIYYQVLLRDGQVELIVVPSSTYTHIRETVTVGEGLHDNEWHSLEVFYQDG